MHLSATYPKFKGRQLSLVHVNRQNSTDKNMQITTITEIYKSMRRPLRTSTLETHGRHPTCLWLGRRWDDRWLDERLPTSHAYKHTHIRISLLTLAYIQSACDWHDRWLDESLQTSHAYKHTHTFISLLTLAYIQSACDWVNTGMIDDWTKDYWLAMHTNTCISTSHYWH